MKPPCHRLMLLILVFLSQVSGCKQDDGLRPLPDVAIVANPPSGNTTDVFEIQVTPVSGPGADQSYFYRWDWNNDGMWDTKFSSNNSEKHRYLLPGNQVIRVEMIDGKKQIRAFTASVQVVQGYSPPKPVFSISPATGNPTTEFTFDARATKDDEDSLAQLEFRWDPLGDGRWQIQYNSSPVARYKYTLAGNYSPKLQVKDPTGRTAIVTGELAVTLEDSLIHADFTITPDTIELNHEAILDASPSRYPPDTLQPLLYSWLLPGVGEWTVPAKESRISHLFRQKGIEKISLRVTNPSTNFFNQVSKEALVVDENQPPTARFDISTPYGNILTQFYFDAWSSTDDRLLPSDLEIRWDFDGDGVWDTPFGKEKTVFHQFSQPGVYVSALQIRDDAGQEAFATRKVTVSGNTNPTSFFQDQRDGQSYGTVKIGEQWWMSENIRYTIPQKEQGRDTAVYWICLNEQPVQCEKLGKLYLAGAVIDDKTDEKKYKVCPPGWHLPSKSDWETLLANIGGEQNGKELRFGGKFDFNGLDVGYGTYQYVWKPGIPWPVDTLYFFKDTYSKSWFFSTTQAEDPNHLRQDVWMMNIDRATLSTWTGFNLPLIYVPARCIKE